MDNNRNTEAKSPFEQYYEFFPSLEDEKSARNVFSRLSLSLFIFLVVAYAAMYGVLALLYFIFANTAPNLAGTLLDNSVFNLIISEISMYLFAFPVLYLIIRKLKVVKTEKRRMSFAEFIVVYCIANAAMYLGNIIGQLLNGIFGFVLDKEIDNGIEEIVNNTPMWLLFISVVILGPIVEELIFRKFFIDRLANYGDVVAITFSAITFGMFHGNFYQFFYAVAVGFVLGYVYARTRNIKLSILLHMIMNFFGSLVAVWLTDLTNKYYELYERLEAGEVLEAAEEMMLYVYSMIISAYSMFNFGLLIAGIILFFVMLSKRKIKLPNRGFVRLEGAQASKLAIINVGSILFILVTLALFALSILV